MQVREHPSSYQYGKSAISGHCAPAVTDMDDGSSFVTSVTRWGHAHRHLIDKWQHYSANKRTSNMACVSKHFSYRYDPHVACFMHSVGCACDEMHHRDNVAAYMDFIYREASCIRYSGYCIGVE